MLDRGVEHWFSIVFFLFVICNEVNKISRGMGAFCLVTTILEFIVQFVGCDFDCSSVDVVIYYILYCTGCVCCSDFEGTGCFFLVVMTMGIDGIGRSLIW